MQGDLLRIQATRKKLDALLNNAVKLLAADEPLPRHVFDHPLPGERSGFRDCHVRPDLVLIYEKPDDDRLTLVRLGSHRELGFDSRATRNLDGAHRPCGSR